MLKKVIQENGWGGVGCSGCGFKRRKSFEDEVKTFTSIGWHKAISKNTYTCSIYGPIYHTHNIKSLNFCPMTWAVNFIIYRQDIMNIITMHDFTSQHCDSTEEYTVSINQYIFTMWQYWSCPRTWTADPGIGRGLRGLCI